MEIILDTGEVRSITRTQMNAFGKWYLDKDNIWIHESRILKHKLKERNQ
jgi:hypothetical protein